MRRKSSSTAMNYSLTEFSYLLLFIFIGASVIIGSEYMKTREVNKILHHQVDNLEKENLKMKREITFLEKTLKKLKNGVVPCWKRPGSPVPEIAGTIIIRNFVDYSIVHHSGTIRNFVDHSIVHHSGFRRDISALADETSTENSEEAKYSNLKKVLTEVFKDDMKYARSKNCYIRVKIENHTNSYNLYRKYADVLKALKIVLVNE